MVPDFFKKNNYLSRYPRWPYPPAPESYNLVSPTSNEGEEEEIEQIRYQNPIASSGLCLSIRLPFHSLA
jgi:hypothetical protein